MLESEGGSEGWDLGKFLKWAFVSSRQGIVNFRDGRVDRGQLSHGASYHNGSLKKNDLIERSIGHILYVSVNANSFLVQNSVIASAALTGDRVLHFLSRKKKFYSLNFHVIDIKHLFNVIDCYIILKSAFLFNTQAGQQYQYVKHGGDKILLQIKK